MVDAQQPPAKPASPLASTAAASSPPAPAAAPSSRLAQTPSLTLFVGTIISLLVLPVFIPADGAVRSLASVRNWQILATLVFAVHLALRRHGLAQAMAAWRAPAWLRPALYGAGLFSLLACAVFHFYAYRINGIDFSTFDHMLWSTRQGNFMYSPILGGNHFGVHPSWIMLPLVPLHALVDSPLLLVAAHPLAIWAALFPLERLARRFLRSELAVVLTLLAYLTHARTGTIANHGFHFEVFYLPIGFWLVESWLAQSKRAFVVWLVLFLSIKEDAGLYVAGLGAGALLFDRERRRVAAGLVALGIAAFVGSLQVARFFRDTPLEFMTFWAKYGSSVPAIVAGMASRPDVVVFDVLRSGGVELFASFLLVPLLGRIGLLACLPAVLLLGTSSSPQMHAYNSYYSSPLLPFFFLAFLEGATRLRKAPLALLVALLVAPLVGGDYMTFPSPRPALDEGLAAAVREARAVGPVCVQTILYPHIPYDLAARPLKLDCGAALVAPELSTYPHAPNEIAAFMAATDSARRSSFAGGIVLVRP